MAQEPPISLQNILGELLYVFEKVNADSVRFADSLAALRGIHRTELEESLGSLNLDGGSRRNLFHLLAVCLNEARTTKSAYLSEAFRILADASRDPKWRQILGDCESHSAQAGWPPDPTHYLHAYSYEQWSMYESASILQVAVRTLHPRYAANLGQAAYHALRLISNCCADNDVNKRIVLECGGIELLLRCADSRLWPDTVIAALWNICAESEDQPGIDLAPASERGRRPSGHFSMRSITCAQLTLRSTAECDDSNGVSLLAAEIENGKRHKNLIQELLDLAEIAGDKVRKEMAAELLEKACSYVLWPLPLLEGTRLTRPDIRPRDFLSRLLTGYGRSLAMSYPACNYHVIRALVLVLSRLDVQKELINQDLVEAFLEVPSWKTTNEMRDEPVDPHTQTLIVDLEKSVWKAVYEVSSSDEFLTKYGNGTDCPNLVTRCIDALGDVSNLRDPRALGTIPAASACVVLANLTKSSEYALFLVQQKKVHLPLGLVLRQRKDSNTLFPALALLDRLVLPPENKIAVFDAGIFHELPRFLIEYDILPSIQQLAISAMRKIIQGFSRHVAAIGAWMPTDAEKDSGCQIVQRTQEQSVLVAALNLFRRTDNVVIKTEVSRLVTEVCRTLFQCTKGYPEQAENAVHLAFGNASDIAHCIAYVTSNGMSQEVQGEGWFGLAMLSTWQYGRPLVAECLGQQEMETNLVEVLKSGEPAFVSNIRMMLTKLRLFPSYLVLASTRESLERAASMAGLPQIWPLLAPAA